MPAIVAGVAFGIGLASTRPLGETTNRDGLAVRLALILTLLALPWILPLLHSAGAVGAALVGLPILSSFPVAGTAAAVAWVTTRRLDRRRLPHGAAAAAAVALGLLASLNGLVTGFGVAGVAVVGAALQAPRLLLPLPSPPTPPKSDRDPWKGLASGFALGGALPILLLGASPLFGPAPGWYGEAITGAAAGLAIGLFAAARSGRFARFAPLLLPLAAAGAGALLLRGPWAVRWLLEHGVPPLVAGSPLAPALVTAGAAAALGLAGSRLGRGAAWGVLAGTVAWVVLPPLLGADGALAAAVGLLALAVLPSVLGAESRAERLGAAAVALAALASLTIAPPADGLRALSPYTTYADEAELGTLLTTAGWRDAETASNARGSAIALPILRPAVWWADGVSHRVDRETAASDALLAHLPGIVLGTPPASILVYGAGSGATLDAARRATGGKVVVVEPSRARREVIQLHASWNRGVGADPAVRFVTTDPLAPPGAPLFGAILVDLPVPWAPGAGHAWSLRTVERVAGGLEPGGAAAFRIPLEGLSGDELAAVVADVCATFGGVTAWLDPTGASHLTLVARHEAGAVDAGAAYRSWSRATVREDLRRTALAGPADVLERMVTDRTGLVAMSSGRARRDAAGTAIVSGARARAGRRSLALSTLAAASTSADRLFDLSTVPSEVRSELAARLQTSGNVRADYLALLGALAAGDSIGAMDAARRIQESGNDATKDLRTLIEPWLDRCRSYRRQGHLDQARGECLIAVSFSPLDPEANLLLADLHRLDGNLVEAETLYLGVRERDVTSYGAALGLAAIRELEGNLDDAAALLEEAEKLHPGKALLLNNLAAVYLRLASRTESDEQAATYAGRSHTLFQAAAALEPRMPEPRAGLANLYRLSGDPDKALTELNRAVSLQPTCAFRGPRAQLLGEMGRHAEAHNEVDLVLMECPEDVVGIGTKGLLLRHDKQCYEQAAELFGRVLQLDPENERAKANLEEMKLTGELDLGDEHCRP